MRLSTKVAYNALIQIISKAAATVLGLFTIGIMTRYLGKEGFGQYTTVITFLSFFAIMADFGLTLVTVQMISRPDADEEKILSNLFSLRLMSALIFLLPAPFIILFFPYSAIIKTGVIISLFSFFFIALNQIIVGLFQKKLRMDKVSIAEVASRIILLAGVVLVVKYNLGLLNILAVSSLSSAVNFLLHYLFSRKFVKINFRFDFSLWKEIIKYSWPLSATIFFNLIYLKTDTLILSLMKSQADVGIYGAAYKVIEVLITLPFMFAGIILPILTYSRANNDTEKFKKVMQKSFDLMAITAIPLIVGAQFTAEKIMILVAGDAFAVSGAILRILIIAAGMIFLGCVFAHGIIAVDKQKKAIGAYIFTALTSVIGYLIFIPKFSYYGAGWVTVYSETIIALASIYLVRKYAAFTPSIKILAKSIFASFIMAAFIYPFKNANLFIILAIGSASYLTSLFILKAITKNDIFVILNK